MVDDRDKEREKGPERPSRPVTAAARRERRASARPVARKDTTADEKSTASKPAGSDKTDKRRDKGTDKAKVRGKGKDESKAARGEHKGRPTPSRDRKDARPGLLSRTARFLREVVAELRKVIWPTRKQMITYTAVVLVFVAFMVALIALLDLGLAKGVSALFG
ncbi:MAG TPA: preprotein translocase subunit SecE [Actinophytocola sp.]|uniref:preprotein translocase subunit SecE n=1 Tax=Actinophytocola sp. TaxID=1872138 RepID=UPI002F935010